MHKHRHNIIYANLKTLGYSRIFCVSTDLDVFLQQVVTLNRFDDIMFHCHTTYNVPPPTPEILYFGALGMPKLCTKAMFVILGGVYSGWPKNLSMFFTCFAWSCHPYIFGSQHEPSKGNMYNLCVRDLFRIGLYVGFEERPVEESKDLLGKCSNSMWFMLQLGGLKLFEEPHWMIQCIYLQ